MSKQVKRKITVNPPPKSRPSVFERLGTKTGKAIHKEFCHHWAQNGTCPYGKTCKYSTTHTLISPSKRLAKTQTDSKKRYLKDASKLLQGVPQEEWDQWNPEELEDADADDLEKRRLELQRELELQMKMEKAHKKQKKVKKESSSESSSSSSDSTSSSDESSSSSSSSVETRRKKTKKTKKRDSSSSSEREKRKQKPKPLKPTKKVDKKKVGSKVKVKSPTPKSKTPPLKIKVLTAKKTKSESKSPRPTSRTSDKKEKIRTPSPKISKEKEKEKERERDREKEGLRLKEKEKDKKIRSPKRDSRPPKDLKKKDSPESSHSRDRKPISPPRSRGSGSNSSRRENNKSPPKDTRRYDSRTTKDTRNVRKDKRDSRDRERDREKERRIAREEREAAREREREEALARCQERQRERERLKKEEERRLKERRDDRGLDKPSGERVERLLPPLQDRIPTGRKESLDKDRRRSPIRNRSRPRKSLEKERNFDRNYDRDYHLRQEKPRYDSPYSHHDRYIEHYPEEHNPEYPENRPIWDEREHIRYREDSRPPPKARDWPEEFHETHEWSERNRRVDWAEQGRESWENRETEGNPQIEEDWRHYNRSMDSWSTTDERRRWNDGGTWRDREVSRPRSSTSHREEETMDLRRKEPPPLIRSEPPEPKTPHEVIPPLCEPKKDVILGKRPSENPPEAPVEPKKICVEEPLVDDLSEISDDADEILNRDEEIPEVNEEMECEVPEPKPESPVPEVTAAPAKPSSPIISKEDSIEEENMDLDFEEISEDELEEEARMKGLGDALGVDWASLVAESRPRSKPITSAKRRWQSCNVLVNAGVSVNLAGEKIVEKIYKEYAEANKDKEETKDKVTNGESEDKSLIPHPVAGMQVIIREKQAIRKSLFASAGPYRRALTARRDLVIRRHLCNLPLKDSYVEPPKTFDPELFKTACKLFQRSL